MTTADIMFARPGSRTLDHESDARTVFLALVAAILIHLAVACLLAALSGVLSPTASFEENPVELTFVDLSPVSKNPAFIETDESKKSAEAPKEKTFESNANSIAASELPASGEAPLPSQAGKDRPSVDLETHAYSLQMNGAQPQPSAAPRADTTRSGYRSGTICHVNREGDSGSRAFGCGTNAILISALEGANSYLREDY